MAETGVYKIQSRIKPERIYIGSAVNLNHRWHQHLHLLRKNTHHSPKLQNHFNKYGESDLIFTTIESCLPEILIIRENVYLNPLPWFNICPVAGNSLGYRHSEETFNKLRKLKPPSQLGLKRSEAVRKRRSEINIQNGNIPPSHKGVIESNETRQKKSKAMKGKNTWMAGTHPSEKTSQKRSVALKKAWALRKIKKVA